MIPILEPDQTDKLNSESQKTKPDLANHDHQILFQTENEANVKDSTLKLALKHPMATYSLLALMLSTPVSLSCCNISAP
jgi:hypothetical protein